MELSIIALMILVFVGWLAILWTILPFAIFGIKPRLENLINFSGSMYEEIRAVREFERASYEELHAIRRLLEKQFGVPPDAATTDKPLTAER